MHHTVPALGADCSASCAGFSLTDLLPLATGHWPRGFWPFGQIRPCTAFLGHLSHPRPCTPTGAGPKVPHGQAGRP